MDYEDLGFKAGLEIHQQLDTKKLFCDCQSVITEDIDYSFKRFLRPTQSELGDVDKAALAEAKKKRSFLYTASHASTCMVEADEEPPHEANSEAIDVALTMALLVDAQPMDEIHFMRKIVIDGSNTSGFQRTALVAMGGMVEDVGIQTIALEEDAARKLKEKDKLVNYGLDRLGIPLIEIATSAEIRNPDHARDVAERIGSLLQATGKAKKGLGTIRQDLNVSIAQGARVEIKGIQSLSSISRVAEQEVLRQKELLDIQEQLSKRGVTAKTFDTVQVVDVTDYFDGCDSKVIKRVLKKDGVVMGVRLPGLDGLLKMESSRLGRDCAVHAQMAAGVAGIIHSDELPGYGIDDDIVSELEKKLNIGENDAFALCTEQDSEVVDAALQAVVDRSRAALNGVLEEVRRALPDDSTEYMRPLPGAARMYPETDVPPIRVTEDTLAGLRKRLPELPEEKHKRFVEEYDLHDEQAQQILVSGYDHVFEEYAKRFPGLKNVILRTFLHTFPELNKEGLDPDMKISEEQLTGVFQGLSDDRFAKEAVPEVLKYLVEHPDADLKKAVDDLGLESVDKQEVEEIVASVVEKKTGLINERGMGAMGPLMGVVMKELRGKADGKLVSSILKKYIQKKMQD